MRDTSKLYETSLNHCMRCDRYRQDAVAVHVRLPRAMECLDVNREEKTSRRSCVLEDAGDEDLSPRPPWGGSEGGGVTHRYDHLPRIWTLEIPKLHEPPPLNMSIPHGIKTLGVIGAGQMGMFSSFAILSTSLPVVQGSVLPMWPL